MIDLICGDCLSYMKKQDDDSFDLAVVDPPYFAENKLIYSQVKDKR